MIRLQVVSDVIRRAGVSSVEAALSAFDIVVPDPAPAEAYELPFASSAEAGLAAAG